MTKNKKRKIKNKDNTLTKQGVKNLDNIRTKGASRVVVHAPDFFLEDDWPEPLDDVNQ